MAADDPIRRIIRLRQYARALSGSDVAGDQLVIEFSNSLADTPAPVDGAHELFALYHDWLPGDAAASAASPSSATQELDREFKQRLAQLGFLDRAMLLLVTVAGFATREACSILRLDPVTGKALLEGAWEQIEQKTEVHVLVVENDALTAMDLCAQVEELGYRVAGVAGTADRARQLVRCERVDLVVTDLSIGGEATGIDLVEELRAATEIPVILVTGHPERAAALRSGMRVQLVSKPFDSKALQFAIMDALTACPTAKLAVG